MFTIELAEISKSYGADPILKNVSWAVSSNDKIGLVGDNASGKSTLIRLMAGKLKPDGGSVRIAPDLTLGYLRQRLDCDTDLSVQGFIDNTFADLIRLQNQMGRLEQEMEGLSADSEQLATLLDEYGKAQEVFQRRGGYDYETRVEFFLTQLGLEALDRQQPVHVLSGGQQARLQLACVLMHQPEVLLLDEPDNHLDTDALGWLEEFLRGYRGAFVLVSHDRYLLDQIATEIVEIEDGKLTKYHGNYSAYKRQKEKRLTAQYYAYVNQQHAISRLEKSIMMLKKWGSSDSVKRARQAKSMEHQLERMESVEKPVLERKRMQLDLELQKRSGDLVVDVQHLTKRYGEHALFKDANFQIRWGEHVALVGANGSGKTTLLRLILGLEPPTVGEVCLGQGLLVSYFDQEQAGMQPGRSIYDELQTETELTVNETRYLLVQLLFHRDEASKTVDVLSGGERNRIMLSKLIYSKANFLILDEPTNHLDATSVEVLEEALADFPGTILVASHDRYLLSRVTNRVIAVDKGTVTSHSIGYDEYTRRIKT